MGRRVFKLIITVNNKMLFIFFQILLTSTAVLSRLDLEPFEPNPSSSTENQGQGGQVINDDVTTATPTVFTCNDTETSFHPDTTDCHNYYICYKGNWTNQRCPTDMAYSRKVKMCVAEHFVKECEPVTCMYFNGVMPDKKNCTRYYDCYYGYPNHFTCPNGTRFDPVSRRCSKTIPCLTGKYLSIQMQTKPLEINSLVNPNEVQQQSQSQSFSLPDLTKFDWGVNHEKLEDKERRL